MNQITILGLDKKIIKNIVKNLTRNYTRHHHFNENHKPDLKFVPKSKPADQKDVENLQRLMTNTKNLFVVTGAGISTESGIPDYRSEGVGLYARSDKRPIQHADFMKSAKRRQVYWARNYTSWPLFSSFKPNINHYKMYEWEQKGKIHYHVTQNVDSLLRKAGCMKLTELHGTSYKVKCMDCHTNFTREAIQILIKSQNPNWTEISDLELSADNDVLLSDEQVENFNTPKCPICHHDRLKPEVGKLKKRLEFFSKLNCLP
jgi:NAD-dependent deacetylase sirtuin 4